MGAAKEKMDDPEVIKQAFIESGLDADKLISQMQDPNIKSKVNIQYRGSCRKRVFGIPNFFVDDEIFFGKDTLWQIEELLL